MEADREQVIKKVRQDAAVAAQAKIKKVRQDAAVAAQAKIEDERAKYKALEADREQVIKKVRQDAAVAAQAKIKKVRQDAAVAAQAKIEDERAKYKALEADREQVIKKVRQDAAVAARAKIENERAKYKALEADREQVFRDKNAALLAKARAERDKEVADNEAKRSRNAKESADKRLLDMERKLATMACTLSSSALGANMEENTVDYLQEHIETVVALMNDEFKDVLLGYTMSVRVTKTGKKTGMMDLHVHIELEKNGYPKMKIMVIAVDTKNGGDTSVTLASKEVQRWKDNCRSVDNMYGATCNSVQKVLMTARKRVITYCDEVGRDESGLIVAGVMNNPSVTRDFIAAMAHAARDALSLHFNVRETAHNEDIQAQLQIERKKSSDLGACLVEIFDRTTVNLQRNMADLMKSINEHIKEEHKYGVYRKAPIITGTRDDFQDIKAVSTFWMNTRKRGKQYRTMTRSDHIQDIVHDLDGRSKVQRRGPTFKRKRGNIDAFFSRTKHPAYDLTTDDDDHATALPASGV